MKLYSYIIVSDDGYAPNPSDGICTLAYCMSTMRRTVQPGDYVVGLAGSEYRKRVGADWPQYPVIYAMRVTDVVSFAEFNHNEYYRQHRSSVPNAKVQAAKTDRALISTDFIYWGGAGPTLTEYLSPLIKDGPGHLCNFPPETIQAFISWFERQSDRGKGCQGIPFDGWFSNDDTNHRRKRHCCCRPTRGVCNAPAAPKPRSC